MTDMLGPPQEPRDITSSLKGDRSGPLFHSAGGEVAADVRLLGTERTQGLGCERVGGWISLWGLGS